MDRRACVSSSSSRREVRSPLPGKAVGLRGYIPAAHEYSCLVPVHVPSPNGMQSSEDYLTRLRSRLTQRRVEPFPEAGSPLVERRILVLLLGLMCVVISACASFPQAVTHPASVTPALLIGTFEDDHGGTHTVSSTEWWQGSRTRYHIVMWDTTERFLIARNDTANSFDADRWTRIDWVPLPGADPYEWAFCFSAYNAPTRTVAEETRVARPEAPKEGCNGYPFSRMKRVEP